MINDDLVADLVPRVEREDPAINVEDEADTEAAINDPINALISKLVVDGPINEPESPLIVNNKLVSQFVNPFDQDAKSKDQFDHLLLPGKVIKDLVVQ